ncbi:MAG: biotin transporter BioY [Acidobacteriota bacterium]|nr:biotin transporter BioY [Acidobacteriota bacterium]
MQFTVPVPYAPGIDKSLMRTRSARAVIVVAASAFVAVCAHLSVPLWFTPVPLSLVNFAVILVGLALGPAAGSLAMVVYLAEGACGLPVFSPHGLGGVAQLLGPTGGFLLSYPLIAAVAGSIARMRLFGRAAFLAALCGSVAATLLLFAIGAGWLAYVDHLGAAAAFWLGVAPFLPGEAAKIAAASGIYTTILQSRRT